MLFTDGLIVPFIIGGEPMTDAVDDLRDTISESFPGDTNVTVNIQLPGEEDIPFHDAADLAPLYVPDWNSFVGQEQVKDMLRVHIDASVMRMEVLDHVLLASGMPGVGKGHDLDTMILTPSGWTRLGDLSVGDEVIGSNGQATVVIDIYDRGVLPLFRVTFSDGSSVRCDPDHPWRVQTPKQRHNGTWQVLDTQTLAASRLVNKAGQSSYYIPMVAPVKHNHVDLPVEPYLAGVMLGNADFAKGVISLNKDDRDIADRINTTLVEYPTTTALRFRPVKANVLIDALGQRGNAAADKFIPAIYLTADLESRRALLAGLLDTDGGVRSGRGSAQFHTTSLALAGGVRTLVESLGGTARVRVLSRGEIRVDINIAENPFRSQRKAGQWKLPTRGPSRSIVNIEPIEAAEVRCIRVAADDHLYVTERYVVTHNTTLARLIAKELMSKLHMLVPPFTAQTLYEAAQRCGEGDVLFIDEIHKLADGGPRGAENLLHLLEERVLYIEGQVIPLQEFTVIGATTDKDKLPEPVLDRFQIKPEFRPYSLSEMVKIAVNFTRFYGIQLSPEIVVAIAKASRRTPRVARELVAGARDLVSARGRMCTPQELLAFKDITPDGLTRTHRAYLVALYRFFGRQRRDGGWEYIAGEASIANVLQENKSAVARLERYLIQNGLVDRTPSGRRLTDRGLARAREFAEQRAGTAVSY